MHNTQFTTFYIVRHGETDWNQQRRIQGHSDIPLNQKGEIQAQEVAKKFKSIKIDLAFASDLLRAKRTAEIIGLEHKLAVETTKALRERHFGTFEGQPSEVFFAHIKLLDALSHEERFRHKFNESSETDELFSARIITFLRETAIAYPGKNVLIGTHGGVIHVLLLHLGVIDYRESDHMRIKNGGYIKLRTDGVDMFVDELEGIIKIPKEQKPSF